MNVALLTTSIKEGQLTLFLICMNMGTRTPNRYEHELSQFKAELGLSLANLMMLVGNECIYLMLVTLSI